MKVLQRKVAGRATSKPKKLPRLYNVLRLSKNNIVRRKKKLIK